MHRSAALLVVAAIAMAATACSGFGESPYPSFAARTASPQPTTAPTFAPRDTPEPAATDAPQVTPAVTTGDLVGTWRGKEPTALGTMSDIETILMANSTFSSLGTDTAVGSMTRFVGKWEVINMSGSPMLRFNITDWDPKQWCGPTGHCTPILPPQAQNKYFRFVDADTLLLWDPGCTTRSCQYVYTRG